MEIIIIRHGKTYGNSIGRYNGTIDDPLCEEGINEAMRAGRMENVEEVYVTPLTRTHQTAAIIFKNAKQKIVENLREMCFGDFEGRTVKEMENDEAYAKWLESNCTLPCPNGESIDGFSKRVSEAFAQLVDEGLKEGKKRIVIVAHGGTIMGIMSTLAISDKTYFDYFCQNCTGYKIIIKNDEWTSKRRFSDFEKLEKLD